MMGLSLKRSAVLGHWLALEVDGGCHSGIEDRGSSWVGGMSW